MAVRGRDGYQPVRGSPGLSVASCRLPRLGYARRQLGRWLSADDGGVEPLWP